MIDLENNAEQALRMVRESRLIAYDTETSGLDWKRNHPVGYVVTDRHDSVYVPVRHGGGGNLNDPTGQAGPLNSANQLGVKQHPFEAQLAKAFEDRRAANLRTVGHHLKFDMHFSANQGIILGRNCSCTQNNQTLINEYTRSYSLDSLGKEYGVTYKRGEEMYERLASLFGGAASKGQMEHFWRTSGVDPVGYDYAAGDGITTLEVYTKQIEELSQPDDLGYTREKILEVENELIYTLFRMERRGIPVDLGYIGDLVAYIEGKIAKSKALLPDEFNPRSPVQMKKLMEQHGHTNWPTTELGNPSFNAKWLESHEIGRAVVGLRQWTNLLNTFVIPLRDEHAFNGVVHASLHQNRADEHGTISGRLSCGSPNMQAVPKHNQELAAKLRAAFIAATGMKFCEADLSQCEPRLFAHYSKDERLVAGYNAIPPTDVHTIVADMLKVDRGTTGKRMNMDIFTGMQKPTFANHMGVERSVSDPMFDAWYELFPAVRDFQNQAKRNIISNGFVRTILGRRGNLESSRFAYVATSKIIQGGNADIIKYKLVEIDKELEKHEEAWLTMSIHDSILWMSGLDDRATELDEWIVSRMVDVQTPPFNLRVPFAADFDSGKNWAEASFGPKAEELSIYNERSE